MGEVTNSPQFNILAHYSNETKVKRPQITVSPGPVMLPSKKIISDKELTNKMRNINTDIYEGAAEQRANKKFNKSLFFKIFGGIVLFLTGAAIWRRW